MKKVLSLLAVLGVAGLAAWWLAGPVEQESGAAARPPVPVTLFTVGKQLFNDELQALGTLQAWESVVIAASVSQIITSLEFDGGDKVARGDLLALLRQDAEQATLRELQVTLADAERELRRLENLAREDQVARNELDAGRTLVEVSRHRIEQVQARIGDRTIRAPFAGTLGLRLVSEGALVAAGQPLTTLDDLSRMRLDFTVPESRLQFLRPGQKVSARTPAFSRDYIGTVTALDSRVDPVARAITARAELANPGERLRPGMLVEVVISGPPRQVLLVPEESLQSRSTEHFVWRVDAAETGAQRVEVIIGGRRPGWVEIVDGLEEGEQIVHDGVGRLSGERMQITPVDF
ncbi:efflux transporter periplasmic adaptor subunit [Kineobactrum sediminis]|uniref:Efflux transporter periplasmic adaptor subunit n=1 Tax=Kineobactrum sediminis TaxID=1905677 RepID=A0A2N5Y7S6_9GAMM|nr:efflux RND transporter periplasmic adaptor subunit [Kineobactrum sediminis]PLW84454.1 efflux transporter periplasmic adaptor subunit [Kineobactrum sediminis]